MEIHAILCCDMLCYANVIHTLQYIAIITAGAGAHGNSPLCSVCIVYSLVEVV